MYTLRGGGLSGAGGLVTSSLPAWVTDLNGPNSLLSPRDFTNAAWSLAQAGGVSAPVVTASTVAAPDGTISGSRVVLPACPVANNLSVVFQNYVGTAASWTESIWVKGNGSSGALFLYFYDPTAGTGNGVVCAYSATAWTRFSNLKTFANATHRFAFGNNNDATITGASDTGAADCFVWLGRAYPT